MQTVEFMASLTLRKIRRSLHASLLIIFLLSLPFSCCQDHLFLFSLLLLKGKRKKKKEAEEKPFPVLFPTLFPSLISFSSFPSRERKERKVQKSDRLYSWSIFFAFFSLTPTQVERDLFPIVCKSLKPRANYPCGMKKTVENKSSFFSLSHDNLSSWSFLGCREWPRACGHPSRPLAPIHYPFP